VALGGHEALLKGDQGQPHKEILSWAMGEKGEGE